MSTFLGVLSGIAIAGALILETGIALMVMFGEEKIKILDVKGKQILLFGIIVLIVPLFVRFFVIRGMGI